MADVTGMFANVEGQPYDVAQGQSGSVVAVELVDFVDDCESADVLKNGADHSGLAARGIRPVYDNAS